MNEEKKITGKKNIGMCIAAVLILCFLLLPLYWALNTSLKTEQEIFQNPPTFYPHEVNTASYAAQVESGDFNMFRSFGNSFLISMGAMLIAVVLADSTIGIPFSVLILKNYFASIPGDLEEAAYLDGCNRFTAFIRILIPIAKPGVMVCAIFSFLYAWGDLAYGMTFILDQEMRPITAGIFNFMGQYGTKWSYLTAFAVGTIMPVALIFIFMQKYIISGMTSGAVKG